MRPASTVRNSKDLGLKEAYSDLSIEDRIELLQQARNANHAKAASYLVSPNRPSDPSPITLEPNLINTSISYVLSRSDHLESNVDSWLNDPDNRPLNRRNTTAVQQPSFRNGAMASFWYLLALLPLVNIHRQGWCSPRTSIMMVLNTVDCFAVWFKRMASDMRLRVSRIEFDQILHNCFVVGLDIIMFLHAFIYLALSFYSSTV